jgi:hypothetical protein
MPKTRRRGVVTENPYSMKYYICLLFAFLSLVIIRPATYATQPVIASYTRLQGQGWAYTVPFVVKNKETIEKLIQCESSGVNISRVDSGGIFSDGILQFHRGPQNTMASSTWESFSKASHISGSPIVPADAIAQTDWALSHNLGSHWTCYRKLYLK